MTGHPNARDQESDHAGPKPQEADIVGFKLLVDSRGLEGFSARGARGRRPQVALPAMFAAQIQMGVAFPAAPPPAGVGGPAFGAGHLRVGGA